MYHPSFIPVTEGDIKPLSWRERARVRGVWFYL
jgi:hypothetical protein